MAKLQSHRTEGSRGGGKQEGLCGVDRVAVRLEITVSIGSTFEHHGSLRESDEKQGALHRVLSQVGLRLLRSDLKRNVICTVHECNPFSDWESAGSLPSKTLTQTEVNRVEATAPRQSTGQVCVRLGSTLSTERKKSGGEKRTTSE